jgi:hypothetical protein
MGIFGKKGPQTGRGTIRKMVTGDGRRDYNPGREIGELSGGIFGGSKKRRR